MRIIDSHIHLDRYSEHERAALLAGLHASQTSGLITVSMDLASCEANLELSKSHKNIYPAFGYHPEQPVPSEQEIADLISWMVTHKHQMVAVGEVGLPYYLRQQSAAGSFQIEPYIELLEQFIKLAGELDKPIVLHAVYDDAPVACELLERHNVQRAHFHWFKGDVRTTQRMISNGYLISITPDVLYEAEIQELVKVYPLEKMMVETDGPWPFAGPFLGQMTVPSMMHRSIKAISGLKRLPVEEVYETLWRNTVDFYRLETE